MKSTQSYNYSQTPALSGERSVLDLSHGHKTTFNAGYLVPFYVEEILPGDSFKVNVTMFTRLMTQIVPIMDNIFLDTFYFFVPNRLVWDNWQRFMGEQDNPGDSTDFVVPIVQGSNATGPLTMGVDSVWDHFGLPPADPVSITYTANALPFRMYNLIFNQWFRDENLCNAVTVSKGNGPDTAALYPLQKRGKRKDYFTSCLPFLQKGPAQLIPLGTSAPVYGTGALGLTDNTLLYGLGSAADGHLLAGHDYYGTGYGNGAAPGTQSGAESLGVVPKPYIANLYADLTAATAATISTLRQAFQIQKLLERDARGGTRYVELLKSHWGVTAPDFRLQRPEYLGGSSARINVNPVQQTSASVSGQTPQGNLSAFAVGHDRNGFTKSFIEHGFVIGLLSVRADLTYQKSKHRKWSRSTRYDYFWPELAHLGEQAVLQKEIYYRGDGGSGSGEHESEAVFGYQERWSEYKNGFSLITGQLRSGVTNSLDVWHAAQNFTTYPVLNNLFIEEAPPMQRFIAVNLSTSPQFLFDSYLQIRAARKMPMYSVPGLVDHF